MFRQTVTREDTERNASNIETARDFYDQFLVPQYFTVTINPGGAMQLTLVMDRRVHNWGFRLGYDFFVKQHEVFEKLHDSKVTADSLRIDNGLAVSFEQHKIMAEISYNHRRPSSPLQFAIGADCSIASKGIENDWTIYGRIGSTF
jgi:hypothetical protein